MSAVRMLLAVAFVIALVPALIQSAQFCATYDPVADAFTMHAADHPSCNPMLSTSTIAVWGDYNDTLLSIGWDVLKLTTNNTVSDPIQARAAGFFEARLTATRAQQLLINNYYPGGNTPVNALILGFLVANWNWLIAATNNQTNSTDPFWVQLSNARWQMAGLLEGYASAADNFVNITTEWALVLAAQGDLMDLFNMYPNGRGERGVAAAAGLPQEGGEPSSKYVPWTYHQPSWKDMSRGTFQRYVMNRSHCSALVKVTPGARHLFFGHSTWQSYGMMMRIYKVITTPFASLPQAANARVSFSSYPGALTSMDDFYLLQSGLTVIETSLSVFNFSLYNAVNPQLALCWQRVVVANRLATTAPEWAFYFSQLNSGTYNNQWIVLDRNLFTPGQDLPNNLLWILEQLPGHIVAGDRTDALRYGYWPSYNVPSFTSVFDLAGYPSAIAAQGPEMLDYQTCVRAQMFREYQTLVDSIPTMQWMMQYNNYMMDPISNDNPIFAIAARGDLATAEDGGVQYFGAIDSKVSDDTLGSLGVVLAFAGPTPQQGAFSFSALPSNATGVPAHVGQPDVYNFSFVPMTFG